MLQSLQTLLALILIRITINISTASPGGHRKGLMHFGQHIREICHVCCHMCNVYALMHTLLDLTVKNKLLKLEI